MGIQYRFRRKRNAAVFPADVHGLTLCIAADFDPALSAFASTRSMAQADRCRLVDGVLSLLLFTVGLATFR